MTFSLQILNQSPWPENRNGLLVSGLGHCFIPKPLIVNGAKVSLQAGLILWSTVQFDEVVNNRLYHDPAEWRHLGVACLPPPCSSQPVVPCDLSAVRGCLSVAFVNTDYRADWSEARLAFQMLVFNRCKWRLHLVFRPRRPKESHKNYTN